MAGSDFYIGEWLIQPSRNRISKIGKEVSLRPKFMDVLAYLAGHAGRVVSKEELLDAIWRQQFITESVLTRAIAEIRRAFDDDAHNPWLIETIAKRGYILIAEVRCQTDARPEAKVSGAEPSFLSVDSADEAAGTGRIPFVARERELERLEEHLKAALDARGCVVFVTGEAGAGKTFLLTEFAQRAQSAHGDLVVASGMCNAHTGIGDPYLPFREILNQLTGDVESGCAAGSINIERARRLWRLLPSTAQALIADGPDLAATLVSAPGLMKRVASLGQPDWRDPLLKLLGWDTTSRASAFQQADLLDQFSRVLQTISRVHPLMLVVDDAQWADAGSTCLLFHLGRRISTSRILVLVAYRPSEVTLGRDRNDRTLETVINELRRDFGDSTVELNETEEFRFLEALLDSEPNELDSDFRETLYRQTKGHPLFTIELIKSMQENGRLVRKESGRWAEGDNIDWGELPAKVEGAIAERIDRLPESSRAILSMASVEGEYFTAEVLASIHGIEPLTVIRMLSRELGDRHRLVSLDRIQRIDGQPLSRYRFRHILIQRFLYERLDAAQRGCFHEKVGDALESFFGDQKAEISAELARHYVEAGIAAKAIQYLALAGKKAGRMSAPREAAIHFSQALKLIETIPETPGRTESELDLLIALAAALMATDGYGAPALAEIYDRTRVLCRQIPDPSRVLPSLFFMRMYYSARARHRTALEVGNEMIRLAESTHQVPHQLMAHIGRGVPLLHLGELESAREHFARVIALHCSSEVSSDLYALQQDHRVTAQVWDALALWLLGYPDQALRRSDETIGLARELDNPFNLAFALVFAAGVHYWRREPGRCLELSQTAMEICVARGFAFFAASAITYRGMALIMQGDIELGIAEARMGISSARKTGAEYFLPITIAKLAEAEGKAGNPAEGLIQIEDGLARVSETGEAFFEAELFRSKGELMRMLGEPDALIEACFLQAVESARKRKAKSLELRAAISLALLGQKGSRKRAARLLLQDVYRWFTEGHETADLLDARVILAQLGQG